MNGRVGDLRELSIAESDRAADFSTRNWAWFLLIGAVVIFGLVFGLTMLGTPATKPAPAGVAVTTTPVTKSGAVNLNGEIAAAGYVVALRRATVAAEITGRLTDFYVQESDTVRKGQLLAQIDARTVDADIGSARAQLRSTQTQIAVLQADFANTRAQYARAVELHGRGFLSDANLLEVQSRENTLRARIAQAKAQVEVSLSDLRRRQVERSRYQIFAPFAGTVTSRNAQIGEIISPISAGGGFTRTGVFTITDLTSLVVDVDVGERYAGQIRPGQPVRLQLDVFPDRNFNGTVIGQLPTMLRERAAVTIRIAFLGPTTEFLPDMAVRATFLSPERAR